MKEQDPIEELIKQRMDNLQRVTEVPSWNDVAISINKRKQQKKLTLLLSSLGIIVIATFIFYPKLTVAPTEDTQNTKLVDKTVMTENDIYIVEDETSQVIDKSISPEPIVSDVEQTDSGNDAYLKDVESVTETTTLDKNSPDDRIETELLTENTNTMSNDIADTPEEKVISKKNKPKASIEEITSVENISDTTSEDAEDVLDDFFSEAETTTTYYNYDSKTGEQISTTEKKFLDSISEQKAAIKLKDSL